MQHASPQDDHALLLDLNQNYVRSAQQSAQQSGEKGSEGTQAEARRAAERLAEAQRMMNGMRQQQASSQVDDLAQRAEGLKDEQKDFEQRLKQTFANGAPQGGRNGFFENFV